MKKWQKQLEKHIKDDFLTSKNRNPRYSLRSFAKRMGLSHSTVSEILHEKNAWTFTETRALKIIEKLNLSPAAKNALRLTIQPEGQSLEGIMFPTLTIASSQDDLEPLLKEVELFYERLKVASPRAAVTDGGYKISIRIFQAES